MDKRKYDPARFVDGCCELIRERPVDVLVLVVGLTAAAVLLLCC